MKKSLPRLEQNDLDAIIVKHELFRLGRKGGARARVVHSDMSHLVLRGRNLTDADFTGSIFFEADLADAVLDNCQFFGCDLRRTNMRRSSLIRADLRGSCLRGASMAGANLSDADLREGSFASYDPSQELSFSGSASGAVDLRGVNLVDANLTGALASNSNFADADMSKAMFIRGDLSGANLSGANLSGANLSQCVLRNANMREAVMVGTVIDPASLVNVDMTGALTDQSIGKPCNELPQPLEAMLKQHKIWLDSKGSDGHWLDLSGCDMRRAPSFANTDLAMLVAENSVWFGQDLSRSNLQAVKFTDSDMRTCNFESADLRGGDFSKANLTNAKFTGANLEPLILEEKRSLKTNFAGAKLRHADFRKANLRGADFSGADLSYANFTDALLQDVNFGYAVMTDTKIETK